MKNLGLVVVVLLVLVGGVALVMFGCGPRGQVLVEKAQAQIDKLIGDMDIKRKEVENTLADFEKAKTKLNENVIRLRVESKQLDDKLVKLDDSSTKYKASLAKLQDSLEKLNSGAEQNVSFGGTNYDKSGVEKMRNEVLAAYKPLQTKVETTKKMKGLIDDRKGKMEIMLATYNKRVTELRSMKDEIVAKIDAYKMMKESSAIAGDTDSTFAETFATLEKKMENLNTEVETKTALEDEMFKEITADGLNVTDILEATAGDAAKDEEVKKILGL